MNATVVSKGPLWTVLSYPHHPGTHVASCGGHFLRAAERLQALHARGLCHADIRALNIVFDGGVDNPSAVIIDYDNTVRARDGLRYPPGWNGQLAERHSGALARELVSQVHDVHALRVMLRQYHAVAASDGGLWASVLEATTLPKCIAALRAAKRVAIAPGTARPAWPTQEATGSPVVTPARPTEEEALTTEGAGSPEQPSTPGPRSTPRRHAPTSAPSTAGRQSTPGRRMRTRSRR